MAIKLQLIRIDTRQPETKKEDFNREVAQKMREIGMQEKFHRVLTRLAPPIHNLGVNYYPASEIYRICHQGNNVPKWLSELKKQQRCALFLEIWMEYVQGKTITDATFYKGNIQVDRIKGLIFQFFYFLVVTLSQNLSHNDLHVHNVLITKYTEDQTRIRSSLVFQYERKVGPVAGLQLRFVENGIQLEETVDLKSPSNLRNTVKSVRMLPREFPLWLNIIDFGWARENTALLDKQHLSRDSKHYPAWYALHNSEDPPKFGDIWAVGLLVIRVSCWKLAEEHRKKYQGLGERLSKWLKQGNIYFVCQTLLSDQNTLNFEHDKKRLPVMMKVAVCSIITRLFNPSEPQSLFPPLLDKFLYDELTYYGKVTTKDFYRDALNNFWTHNHSVLEIWRDHVIAMTADRTRDCARLLAACFSWTDNKAWFHLLLLDPFFQDLVPK
jgi:serine/threonine protein kinase